MFFRRKEPLREATLLSVVRKTMDTGFVFWNISDDLGHSCKEIMSSTSLVKMSYGYARRSAAAALYVQGLVDKASYEHVVAMFKALQSQTGQTVEFQEAAAADASEFLRSYHYLISSFFEKKTIQIANEYEIPKRRLTDAELFGGVFETANVELVNHLGSGSESAAKPMSGSRLAKVIADLTEISERESQKVVTMWIQPVDESWSCELNFSNEELELTNDLVSELHELMEFRVSTPVFPYKAE